MTYVPDWWSFALLWLAAMRTCRLLGWDTILDRPRDWLTGRGSYESPSNPGSYRRGLDIYLKCPWCHGTPHVLAWWGAWMLWPHAALLVAVPWALGEAVGLGVKHLDE